MSTGIRAMIASDGAKPKSTGPIQADGPDVILHVKVVPGASRTRLAGLIGDRLKVAVAAPPEKGKANQALAAYLAELCGLRGRDITVEAGLTAPTKTVRIRQANIELVRRAVRL